jgi:hypothetical protein
MIKSWATLEWYLPLQPADLPVFDHVSTRIRDDGSPAGCRCGDTVWMALNGQQPAGLAWEWSEVRPGMVMLSDPNSIITNLQFVDEQQNQVLGLNKTVMVNRLVHALAWQAPVSALLQQAAAPAHEAEMATPARRHTDLPFGTGPRRLPAQRPALDAQARLNHQSHPARAQNAELHTPEPVVGRAVSVQTVRPYSRATDLEKARQDPLLSTLRRAA